MDIIRLYQDYSVNHATEGHKHTSPGWVNTECPFCTGNPGWHLGYSIDNNYFSCYRCGWHPKSSAIAKLINVTKNEAKKLIRQYGGRSRTISPTVTIRRKSFKFPNGTTPLTNAHKQYLSGRGFDPDRLEHEWGLMSTGPVAKLDETNYKHRIIIPITWDDEVVSFQSRDATDKSGKKYLACSKARETIHHKDILYGNQNAWGETGICVEGATDVWRFGKKAFGTFGIKYTPKQLRWMSRIFKQIAVIFDDEPQAISQAYELVEELRFRGVGAFRIPIVGDPGAMTQSEADYLIKQILK